MAIELAFGRIISIFFGNYLFTWSTIIGVTMGGLAIGNLIGGTITTNFDSKKALYIVSFINAFICSILLLFIYELTEYFSNFRLGYLWSTLIMLLPIMICFGIFNPLLISLIIVHENNSGKASGIIYGVHTAAGIAGIFLTGFYLIPNYGSLTLLYLTIIILLIAISLYLLSIKSFKNLAAAAILFIFSTAGLMIGEGYIKNNSKKILYEKDGLLGQIIVEDQMHKGGHKKRILYIDRAPNSVINPNTKVSEYNYVHKIAGLSTNYPERSKALILGMGGGSSVIEYLRMGFNVDVVELDNNVAEATINFLGLSPSQCNLTIDDARHFIQTTKNKYDLIVIDIIVSENFPVHIYTIESLNKIKNILNENGTAYFYFIGAVEGEKSIFIKSFIKTLALTGLKLNIYAEETIPEGMKVITASKSSTDPDNYLFERMNSCCKPYIDSFVEILFMNFDSGLILKDDVPILEILYINQLPEYKVRNMYWKKNQTHNH